MADMPQQGAPHGASHVEDEVEFLRREISRRDETISTLRNLLETLYQHVPTDTDARVHARELSRRLLRETEGPGAHIDIARQLRQRLTPETTPQPFPGVHVATTHQTATRVGGDLFDVFDMGSSCLGIFIGDVSSTGLPAAFIMTLARMALHTCQVNEYSPKIILERINAELCHSTLKSQFMSAFFAVLDTETDRLKYVNASHCAPILYGKDKFELLETEGAYCGMFEDAQYEEKEIQLQPGHHVLLYTDGLIEAFNSSGERYTAKRLYDLVESGRDCDVEGVMEAVTQDLRDHMQGREMDDDVTLVGVDILSRDVKENCVTIPTEPKLLPKIEDAIEAKLNEHNYGERAVFAVRLAVEEAMINAMKHGNRMDKAKTVTVKWSIDDHQAAITIEDEGDGFDPAAVPDPTTDENLAAPHGRGIMLMRAYMDKVDFSDKGNRVTLVKHAPWSE